MDGYGILGGIALQQRISYLGVLRLPSNDYLVTRLRIQSPQPRTAHRSEERRVGKEYDYSLPAVQGVQFCSRLFDCERYSKAKNHTAEQRKQFRLEKEKPILEAFWNWLDQQRPNKGTRLAKAVNYAQNRKDTLMTYLEDGHCSLSNNLSENAIRPFTVGRKNWLFSASPKGAASSAIVYTMVEMAKANDLNTYKYLTYLLSQRPDAKMSDEQLEQLAPWSETAKANCQN